jgi:hypothetical protein
VVRASVHTADALASCRYSRRLCRNSAVRNHAIAKRMIAAARAAMAR